MRIYGYFYLYFNLIFDRHFRRGYLHGRHGGTLSNCNSSPEWDRYRAWQRGFDLS